MGVVAIGAFIGGAVAQMKGGNVIMGMAMGAGMAAIGGAIAGQATPVGEASMVATEAGPLVTEPMAVSIATPEVATALPPGTDVVTNTATGVVPQSASAVTPAAAVGPEALTDQVTQQILNPEAALMRPSAVPAPDLATGTVTPGQVSPIASQPASPAAAELAGSPSAPASAPATTGPAPTPGATFQAPPPGSKGLLADAMAWANKNPVPAAMVMQTAGGTLTGIGAGVGGYLTEQQKLENQEALMRYYRDFVQAGSKGGKGVTINARVRPSTPSTQGGGLIGNQLA